MNRISTRVNGKIHNKIGASQYKNIFGFFFACQLQAADTLDSALLCVCNYFKTKGGPGLLSDGPGRIRTNSRDIKQNSRILQGVQSKYFAY